MKRKKVVVFVILVLVLLVVALFIPVRRAAFFRANSSYCMNNLCSLAEAFELYSMDHNGRFPPNMTELVGSSGKTRYISQPKQFLCIGSHSQIGGLSNVDKWSDYIYIPWSTGITNTPPDYPIMYDRRLSNHQGKGIIVLFVDRSASWDEGATELKTFAAKHPDLHIPMPEDLK